jgi:hypothetical protein
MAIQIIEIQGDSGPATALCCWYTLNEHQQFIVIGCDDRRSLDISGGEHGIEAKEMGRLTDQNFIFEQQIVNSLRNDGWNFELFPNPEIILLTDHRAT